MLEFLMMLVIMALVFGVVSGLVALVIGGIFKLSRSRSKSTVSEVL
ncbi:MAG: hypothetical protein GXP52_08710 [Deltaproteobacteria bacterium]|nr:hypothetical protein [Deltaproteobacteria bacterium]